MSYILEALKKSEQERNPDKVPDISSHHEQVVMAPKKTFPWIWFVVALVVLNLVTFYWLYFNQPKQVEVVPVTSTPASEQTIIEQPKQENKPVIKETVQEPVVSQPVSKPAEEKTQPETVVQQVATPPPTPAPLKYSDLPHITELSMAIQSQLPSLSFSTHVYVSGGGGFVIINDRNLSDGMSMGSGLVLEKIVSEGVILSFRDRAFTLRAMESWDKN